MACRCGGTFLTPILAIAGLAAAGAAGYKMINGCGTCTTGSETALVSITDDKGSCPLCPGHSTECEAHVQTASATEASSCCSEKAATSCCSEKDAAKVSTVAAAPKADGCCMSKGEANVKTVAATEVKKEGCCSEGKSEAKVEKVCKEGTDGCTGDGKEGCCGGCEGKKKEEKKEVATSGK
jgi:hypothetical protein